LWLSAAVGWAMVNPIIDTLLSDEELLNKVKQVGGATYTIALLGVPYYYFKLPYYDALPTSLLPILNLWLLFSGMGAVYLVVKSDRPRVRALKNCPQCGKDLEVIINPELKCPVCGIIKFDKGK
jgi:DNA-directed RNA polymerase subunit RPC12/RpoP